MSNHDSALMQMYSLGKNKGGETANKCAVLEHGLLSSSVFFQSCHALPKALYICSKVMQQNEILFTYDYYFFILQLPPHVSVLGIILKHTR